ncbi:MAG TPA: MBL fold metallo-hydrolase [Candidatus Acidoferrales bacterium]|nr:MBL fold metallo-hydrolase [Candidatus Acidoferrales bacterium]
MNWMRMCAWLCLATLTAAAARGQGPAGAQAPGWELTPVAEGVYAAIGKNGAYANSTVIVNRDDVLVVDTSMRPSWGRLLVEQIKKLTDKPVRYVVNTHWHPDHTQGNQAFAEAYGPQVEFIAQRRTDEDITGMELPYIQKTIEDLPGQIAKNEATLESGKNAEGSAMTEEGRAALERQVADQKAYLGELKGTRIPARTLTFESSLYVEKPGGRVIEILNFGKGHTRGDAVVFLPAEKVVVTGDLLTGGIPFYRDSYPTHWVEVLEEVEKLDWTTAIPGHGDVQHGKEQIGKLIAFMRDLLGQVKAAAAQGKNLEETKKAVNLSGRMADFPVYKSVEGYQRAVNVAIERCWMEATGKITE